ncbi:glycosyltransferase family 4 protein [Synoicihabitans lomoniglobus]|uniref:Glycosyltransferase family 4 protein n=1 Tax=Synoicihabitans lomoniglobus TaxID=2909285 RepID=A0AAF0I5N5_9BACT|nr:glycosyltransferase family 4 protein [Opitutaceae bacterium LMO-M01]WED67379.1 glycosyltransferase family 4 protein [Opitutaceae bacterium LMO-M01]
MTKADAPEIVHGLETPYPLRPFQNYFRLEGWALIKNGAGRTRARVRIDQKVFLPESEPLRDDVAVLYPEIPYARTSGFVFVCLLPFGNYLGSLEVSNDGGSTWHTVRNMMIPVSSHPLMGAFETAGTDGVLTETKRLAGWLWHPEFTLREVVLLFGNIAVPVKFGVRRPDVGSRFPGQPEAQFSGFITCENLPRGKGPIRLQATTTCGRVYFLDAKFSANLPTGAYLKPRSPRDIWELPPARLPMAEPRDSPTERGSFNLLFVLYGDFTSNSASHISAFANELIARGFDCIVAVPEHAETIGALPDARFMAIEYADLGQLPSFYRDGRPPTVVHAWTTRELVRQFSTAVASRFGSQIVVHLEDNEQELLANHIGCTRNELNSMDTVELDSRVPTTLSHPRRAAELLAKAVGVTTIITRLTEFVPPHVPHVTIWPAAAKAFYPRETNAGLRAKLGLSANDIVLFYHGNVHQANAREVGDLYRAVEMLNDSGLSTWLVRTGRNEPEFAEWVTPRLRGKFVELGFIKRSKDLPTLMSMADFFVQPGSAGAFNDYRFPSKLPEFFALGRPVILPSSNLGETLQHGRDAFILEKADSAGIASAISTLHQNKGLAKKLAAGAIAFAAENFSWTHSTDRLLEFYLKHTSLKNPGNERRLAAKSLNAAFAPTNCV